VWHDILVCLRAEHCQILFLLPAGYGQIFFCLPPKHCQKDQPVNPPIATPHESKGYPLKEIPIKPFPPFCSPVGIELCPSGACLPPPLSSQGIERVEFSFHKISRPAGDAFLAAKYLPLLPASPSCILFRKRRSREDLCLGLPTHGPFSVYSQYGTESLTSHGDFQEVGNSLRNSRARCTGRTARNSPGSTPLRKTPHFCPWVKFPISLPADRSLRAPTSVVP
jgi:hypothetical protein